MNSKNQILFLFLNFYYTLWVTSQRQNENNQEQKIVVNWNKEAKWFLINFLKKKKTQPTTIRFPQPLKYNFFPLFKKNVKN